MQKESVKDSYKDLNLEDFITSVYYLVDNLYSQISYKVFRPGDKPSFSDSEIITLNLVGQMVHDSENGWYRFVKKNYLRLFPQLLERSRYHRRCKDSQQMTELIRKIMINRMGFDKHEYHLMDSIPVPVCVYARASRNLRFSEDFGIDNDDLYGYCASKEEKIYGFKLHVLETVQGVPVHSVLAPASEQDVVLAPELLESYRPNLRVGGDKGYVGLDKRLENDWDFQLIIAKRRNQKEQNTVEEKFFLKKFRRIIETSYSQLAGQFHLQFTRGRSKWGLQNRIIAKLTAFTLAIYLNFLAEEPLLEIKGLVF
jgi:hypothetical protein